MKKQKIKKIRKLAHSIDSRINLFEGLVSKETSTYKGELLFWRQIVNMYGLFADCDRVQVKEKHNLIELMKRYSQKDIAAEMERGAILKRTNKEIIQDSIRNSGLI